MTPPTFAPCTVDRVWRDPERGFWHAVVRSGEAAVELDTRHGSWQTPPLDPQGRRRDASPSVAALLQREVRARTSATAGSR